MIRLIEQINYAKFTETTSITLDLNYAENLLQILEKLTQQPTFEECIKEWEDDGWYYSTSKEYENHIFYKNGTFIKIFKYNKSYIKESYYADCEGPLIAKPILPKEHSLIHKTIKAMEEMKGENSRKN